MCLSALCIIRSHLRSPASEAWCELAQRRYDLRYATSDGDIFVHRMSLDLVL